MVANLSIGHRQSVFLGTPPKIPVL